MSIFNQEMENITMLDANEINRWGKLYYMMWISENEFEVEWSTIWSKFHRKYWDRVMVYRKQNKN